MKYRLLSLCVPLLLALVLSPTVGAQSPAWSAPEEIPSQTKSNWFPSVTVDPLGSVHLVWSSGKGEGPTAQDLLMYSRKDGDAWTASNDVMRAGIGGYAARNSIVVDRTGRLHALVRGRDGIYYVSAYREGAESARAWSEPHKLNGLGQGYYGTIAIDDNGILHVVWQELSPRVSDQSCEGCSDVWYRKSLNGGATWTAPMNLSNGDLGSSKTKILITEGGRLYISWDEGKDPLTGFGQPTRVAYATSDDNGDNWSEVNRVELPEDVPQQMTLGEAGSGDMLMVFRSTARDLILYRVSDDQGLTWSDPQPIPGVLARSLGDTPWDSYSMATDSAGNVHLLAVARLEEKQEIPVLMHLAWDSESRGWSAPEAIVTDQLFPEWPQLTIANGNQMHAVWFTRNTNDRFTSETGQYQVWYSRRDLATPALEVKIEPTPTPIPTLTPIPIQPTIEPTMLATEALKAPIPLPVRDEAPLLLSLGMAITPVVGLCLLLLMIAGARRKLK